MPARSPSTTFRVSISPDSTPRTAKPIRERHRAAPWNPERRPRTLPFIDSSAACMMPVLR